MNADIGLIFLLIITIVIGWLLGYREATRKRFTRTQDYLRNWFSDESAKMSDAAFSQLSSILDFDEESFETFIALGAMYRKQGNLQKAIELHELLAKSSSLGEEYQQQAKLELGKDYAASGIQDRAENAFLVCKESPYIQVKRLALRELLSIYKKQRDWDSAIQTVSELLDSGTSETLDKYSVVHYLCEKAVIELSEQNFSELKRTFKTLDKLKVKDSKHYHRVMLLKLQEALAQSKTDDANQIAIDILKTDPLLISRVSSLLDESQRNAAFNKYVLSLASELEGASEKKQDLYLLKLGSILPELFKQLPETLQNKVTPLQKQGIKASYVCHQCGFKTHVFTWDCSSCMSWYSFKLTFSTLSTLK